MSKPKPDKFTAGAKLEKHRQDKPFVQVEGELTETQLEAISASLRRCAPSLARNAIAL